MFIRALLILLAAGIVLSCNSERRHQTTDAAKAVTDSLQQLRVRRTADSIKYEQYHTALMNFYRGLINSSVVTEDTSWHQDLDRDLGMDYDILIPWNGDNPPEFVAFPFKDMHMSYHLGVDRCYFSINGQRIPETVYTGNNKFPVNTIHRFTYGAGKYLVFGGGLRDYNGYGDRINFNYFFDLTAKHINADMYQNSWMWVDDLFLYGDLNNDGVLDRVRFDGISRPSYNSQYDTITFNAETYSYGKWKQLTDSVKSPYFIKVLVEEDELKSIVSQYWPKPIPAIP